MKAITQPKYGSLDILKLEEVLKPVPKENEVLVKIHAASVNYGNVILVSGTPYIGRLWSGLKKPNFNIPGGDLAGIVKSVGKNVTHFQPGDEVYGDLASCGFGTFAEYVSAPEKMLALKPKNINFEEAAAVPQAAMVALQALRNKGNLQAGQKVLIYGASSGNGTFAVQIAKAFGAEVTGVCSTGNVELVCSLGADHIIDYKKEDFLQSGEKYDLILGMAGFRQITDYKKALKPGGTYVSVGGDMKQVNQGMMGAFYSLTGNKKLTFLYQKPSQDDLNLMKELIEAGKVKPVIDKIFELKETVEALKYYSNGHSCGKVIIKIN